MTTSCVKGAVLVDWVQGFCCVRKEGRAKGPCLHCFVAGDVNSGSGKVRLSGGHLTNFVTHERSRSLNQSLNNTPHRTLYPKTSSRCYAIDVYSLQTKYPNSQPKQTKSNRIIHYACAIHSRFYSIGIHIIYICIMLKLCFLNHTLLERENHRTDHWVEEGDRSVPFRCVTLRTTMRNFRPNAEGGTQCGRANRKSFEVEVANADFYS
jgi:hypothetical protein